MGDSILASVREILTSFHTAIKKERNCLKNHGTYRVLFNGKRKIPSLTKRLTVDEFRLFIAMFYWFYRMKNHIMAIVSGTLNN